MDKRMINIDKNEYEDEKIEEKELDDVSGGVRPKKDELDDFKFELRHIMRTMF